MEVIQIARYFSYLVYFVILYSVIMYDFQSFKLGGSSLETTMGVLVYRTIVRYSHVVSICLGQLIS